MMMTDTLIKALGSDAQKLSEAQYKQFEVYFEKLKEVGAHTNLTSILDDAGVAEKHFADSLVPWQMGLIAYSASVIDVGAGAGLPGLPLKIAQPSIDVTLLEATGKKAVFMQTAAQAMDVDAKVINARAEEIAHDPDHRMWYDICVSRAVARLGMLLELCAGFVKPGGYMLAYKGEKADEEIAQAKSAAKALGLKLVDVKALPGSGVHNKIVVYQRVEKLADKYPRKFANIKNNTL